MPWADFNLVLVNNELSSTAFRAQSATEKASYALKHTRDRTYDDQQACHRIENAHMARAFNSTSDERIRSDIMGEAHSDANIFYGAKNNDHTAMERAMATNTATQDQWERKTEMLETGFRNMKQAGDMAAKSVAHVMQTVAGTSDDYNDSIASLDMRTHYSTAEKHQIAAARARRDK